MDKTKAKVFEGCRHPELIDAYIRGVKDGATEKTLKAVAKEVEELRDIASDLAKEYDNSSLHEKYQYWRGRKHVAEYVLNLINNHLDNEQPI